MKQQDFKKSMKKDNDEMYTPSILVYPILKYLKPNSTIWCPFDTDDSEFVRILRENNHFVICTHIFMGEEYDFFEFSKNEFHYDYIISNPPFSKKLAILERLYEINKPFAMLLGLPILNYQEIGNFFYRKESDLQLLIFDKKVSFNGNTASFNCSYFCRGVLPKDIIFHHLEHNNTKDRFFGSRMTINQGGLKWLNI